MDSSGFLYMSAAMVSYALLCVGVLWFVRAGMFALVADAARIFMPATVVICAGAGVPAAWAVVLTTAVWLALAVAFWFAWDIGGADDVLLSLGLQGTVVGLTTYAVVTQVKQRFLVSPLVSDSAPSIAAAIELVLVVISVYLLSFSHLRVPLAHAAAYRAASNIYPAGGRRLRAGATLAGAACLAVAGLTPLATGSIGIDQWKDGIGILALGIANALRRNALFCAIAGGLVAGVKYVCDWILGNFDVGALGDLLPVLHLFAGLAVIICGVIWSRFNERHGARVPGQGPAPGASSTTPT